MTTEQITTEIRDRLVHSDMTPFPKEWEATVLDVRKLQELVVQTAAVQDYGAGLLVFPFSAKAEFVIRLHISYGIFLWIKGARLTPLPLDKSRDSIHEIESYNDLSISGTIAFQIESRDGKRDYFGISRVSVEAIDSVEFVNKEFAKKLAEIST